MVRCDAEHLFALLAAPARIPAWRSDIIEAARIDDSEAPLAVGHRYREVIRFMGRQEQTFEVVALEVGANTMRLVVRAIGGLALRPTQSFTVERADEGACRLVYDVVLPLSGRFRLLRPLLARMIPKKWRGYADALRLLAERESLTEPLTERRSA